MVRILFSIIFSALLLQNPSEAFSENFPKVLSCVKGESNDFKLHLVTVIEQNDQGTGKAFVDDRLFNLVLDEGIWLGTGEKGTEFLILENDKIKITKLAQGLPVGGEIEQLDDGTLLSAFKNRVPVTD